MPVFDRLKKRGGWIGSGQESQNWGGMQQFFPRVRGPGGVGYQPPRVGILPEEGLGAPGEGFGGIPPGEGFGPPAAWTPVGQGQTRLYGYQPQQPQQSPYQTIPTTKSGELSDRIRDILSNVGDAQQSTDRTLRNYENALNQGKAKQYAGQEADYLSSYFDGSAESRLAGIRGESADALRRAGDLARENVRRDLKLSGLRTRGGASSRLDRMALDRNLGIETDIANRMSGQRRADFDYLNRLRSSAVGQRQGIYDRLAQRQLMGQQARLGMLGQQAGLLGQLGAADRANTVYHLAETPEYTQQRQYQAALGAEGMNPLRVPGTNYAYDMNQTDPWARFPKAPWTGYGVNPVNNRYGYQYALPVNQYPEILGQV